MYRSLGFAVRALLWQLDGRVGESLELANGLAIFADNSANLRRWHADFDRQLRLLRSRLTAFVADLEEQLVLRLPLRFRRADDRDLSLMRSWQAGRRRAFFFRLSNLLNVRRYRS